MGLYLHHWRTFQYNFHIPNNEILFWIFSMRNTILCYTCSTHGLKCLYPLDLHSASYYSKEIFLIYNAMQFGVIIICIFYWFELIRWTTNGGESHSTFYVKATIFSLHEVVLKSLDSALWICELIDNSFQTLHWGRRLLFSGASDIIPTQINTYLAKWGVVNNILVAHIGSCINQGYTPNWGTNINARGFFVR